VQIQRLERAARPILVLAAVMETVMDLVAVVVY
jgi:hypothetical protein